MKGNGICLAMKQTKPRADVMIFEVLLEVRVRPLLQRRCGPRGWLRMHLGK